MMTDEDDEIISITFRTYWRFFGGYYGPWFFICIFFSLAFMTGSRLGNDYLIGKWAQSGDEQQTKFWTFFPLYVGFTCAITLGAYLRVATAQLFTWRTSRNLHRQMVAKVIRAPVNLYFDVTPIGRILNKFSKDLNAIETQTGWQVGMLLQMVFSLLQIFFVAVYAVKFVGLVIPCLLALSYIIVNRSASSIKETVRLFNTTKSPYLSYLGETINGSSTIRAFDRQADFIEGSNKLLNNNILALQMMAGVSCWFSIRVDVLSIFLMFTISMIAVLARGLPGQDPIVLSMLLSYILTIQFNLTWSLKCFMYLQSNLVNADRCMKLLEVPQERTIERGQKDLLEDRPRWPENGIIEFKDVHLKYRPETETVLNGLTFRVNPGEKIGVVGRTGAGKSTICLSISRIVEIFQG